MTFLDIQNRTYDLSDTDSTSFPVARLTRALEAATSKVFSRLLILNGWELDDSNYTDLPVAKAALVSGQQDYSLGATHQVVRQVEIKDSSGAWSLLDPIDRQDLRGSKKKAVAVGETTRTGAYKPTSGIPTEYDISGYSLLLYPASNYSQAGSLLVYFSRGQLNFSYVTSQFSDSTGSTSSSPGFSSLFHDILPIEMALDYCNLYKPSRVPALVVKLRDENERIDKFYEFRNMDKRRRITVGYHDTK